MLSIVKCILIALKSQVTANQSQSRENEGCSKSSSSIRFTNMGLNGTLSGVTISTNQFGFQKRSLRCLETCLIK